MIWLSSQTVSVVAGLAEIGNDFGVVLGSSLSSLRLAALTGHVSRRSAARTIAVRPTSFMV